MIYLKLISCTVILFSIIYKSHALECYICSNQEGNVEKCLKTFAICSPGQDACMTEIKWGSPPYWSQGAQKQFYVSKRCSTKRECERIRKNNMPDCTHIWYEDWKCSECCQGDRCNYYIFSGSGIHYPKILIIASLSITSLLYAWKWV